MKKNAIITSILMIVLMSVLTVNCTKQDFSLSENVAQFSDWNIPDGISQFITQNFESYQSYLDMGGIPMDDLIEIINETTSDTGSNGDEHNTIHECISKYYNDTQAFHECMSKIDPTNPQDPSDPTVPIGPGSPTDPFYDFDTSYEKLEYFFTNREEVSLVDFEIISNIDYDVPESVEAAYNILKRDYPAVVRVAEEYYKNPNIITHRTRIHNPSYCAHYVITVSKSKVDPSFKELIIDKTSCSDDVIPPFGDNTACLNRMLNIARSIGLESSFFIYGGNILIPSRSYYLLKNIAEKKDAFPIVYPPTYVN